MKIMKRLYILFLIFSIWSCDTSNMFVGGGTAPDISAPEIGITTPENLAYQSGSFFVAGTVTDNVKVTKVELSVFCNGERVSDKGNPPTAVIAGNQWSYKFENLKSGEYTITATAFDKAGNQSENSSKTIVVTVDNEESEVKIQKPNLKPQETLVELNYRE
ncbi:MAG: Ig-like domain-containing protein, partial [Spirochaetota bacterium]|nr:Ig-like domain-containing protein [Spirochaetota bacterium]